jgi:hypothetical protein
VFSINQELDAQVASSMDGSSKGVFFYVLSTLELVAQVASDMDGLLGYVCFCV